MIFSNSEKASVLRDSVNGVNKYARVVIRRKRTPILAEEFVSMFNYQFENRLTEQDLIFEVQEYLERDDFVNAGKILTYLDFMKLIEVEKV